MEPDLPGAPEAEGLDGWRVIPAPEGMGLRWQMTDELRGQMRQMLEQLGGIELEGPLADAPFDVPPAVREQMEQLQAQLSEQMGELGQRLEADDLEGMLEQLRGMQLPAIPDWDELQGQGGLPDVEQLRGRLMEQLEQLGERGPDALPPALRERLPQDLAERMAELDERTRAARERVEQMRVELQELRRAGPGGVPEALRERMENLGGSLAVVSVTDGEHTLALTTRDGERTLRATESDGTVVYDGPLNTAGELEQVPESIRPKVERLLRSQGGPQPVPEEVPESERPRPQA